MGTSLNKTDAVNLKNNAGINVNRGDCVVIDLFNSDAFTVTGSSQLSSRTIGVVLDTGGILTGTQGLIAFSGYVPQINLLSGSSIGQTIGLSSVAGKAMPHSTILPGDFGVVLSTGLTPDAILWGISNNQTFPKRATIFSDEFISSTAFISQVDAIMRYNSSSNQSSPANGDSFTFGLNLQKGTYTCSVLGHADSNRAMLDWSFDGVIQTAGQDWYSGGPASATKTFTITCLSDGYHILSGKINGKNGSSTNFYWSLTKVWIAPTTD